MRAPEGHAPGARPLPCQNRNNSTKGYRLKRSKPGADPVDHMGRVWDERAGGWFRVLDLSGPDRKAAYKLRMNVQGFVRRWTRNHCAFFTLTDLEGVHPKEFGRRWNSFLTHEGAFIRAFCRVVEPQPRSGRVHYHLLVSVAWDMRPDAFEWEAFFEAQKEFKENGRTARFRELTRRYRESAGPETVAMWKRLRKVLPDYGLGRSEFLPVRKGHEALSEYVGKYLEAGLQMKRHNWKGVRRVETDRRTAHEWRQCVGQFSWASDGAREWRQRVGELAAAAGVDSLDGLTRRLGPRWAYRMKGAIVGSDADEWRAVLDVVSGGESVAWPEWDTPPCLPPDWDDRQRQRESRALSEDSFVCIGPGGEEVPSPAFRVRRFLRLSQEGPASRCDAKHGPPATI